MTSPVSLRLQLPVTYTDENGVASTLNWNLVATPPQPVIVLTSSVLSLALGGTVILTAIASNATQAEIADGGGNIYLLQLANGTAVLTVSPVATTTYTASASGPGGTAASLPVTVTVSPPLPPPPPPPPGLPAVSLTQTFGQNLQLSTGTLNIAWKSAGAPSLKFNGSATLPNGSPIPSSGSYNWPLNNVASPFTLTLAATNAAGSVSSSVGPIAIIPSPPVLPTTIPQPWLSPSTRPPILGRRCLTMQDFGPIQGAFTYSDSTIPGLHYSTCNSAFRYVSGHRSFFVAGPSQTGSLIGEFPDPGFGTPTKPNVATTSKVWGDLTAGLRGPYSGGATTIYGLLWDPVRNGLLTSYGPGYVPSPPISRSLLWTAFNADGTTASTGPYGGAPPVCTCNKTGGGATWIPGDFAQAYLKGMNLGIGFGGSYSIEANDSNGFFLAAVSPPSGDPNALTPAGIVPFVSLVDYPTTTQYAPAVAALARFPNYTNLNVNWWPQPPVAGMGAWGPCDNTFGAACFIDTGAAWGLLVVATEGIGNSGYLNSDLYCDSVQCVFRIYDPADLAAVATGTIRPWQVQPVSMWVVVLPVVPGYPQQKSPSVTGAAWDLAAKQVLLTAQQSQQDGTEFQALVYGLGITA